MDMRPSIKLRHCPHKQIALALPGPLSARLDGLLALADMADEPATRKALVASLILYAPASAESLAQAVKDYRIASVQSALIAGYEFDTFVEPYRVPGPRPAALRIGPVADKTRSAPGERNSTDRLVRTDSYRVGIAVPEPIEQRLDDLVSLLDGAGETTTRRELVCALILSAPETPSGIGEMLGSYRAATVADARVGVSADAPSPKTPMRTGRQSKESKRSRR